LSLKQEGFVKNREEFAQIDRSARVLDLQKQMNESYKTPKIGAFLDGGFQGFGFKVWDKQAYVLAGAQIELPLYNAGNSKLKIQQSQIELEKLAAQRNEVLQQIQLQIQLAQTNLETAQQALKVNEAELAAAREYYRLTERRYREGQALQLEVTDARTQMTTAELKQSLAQYTVLTKLVELERATGNFDLK
jgi:outer membrane protein TolC